jgi:phosphate:Na+ symporter
MNVLNLPFLENVSTLNLVLLILGGLGAFLVGMNILQKSTEKLATEGLKKLFAKTANNPFIGVGIGTLATMIMQSSGATTVMVVGFVNSGAMSLFQATAYIMGANIGTTITAQLAALSSFPFTYFVIALTLLGVFLSMLFQKKHEKIGEAGDLVAGLGLLFLGLIVMSDNMTALFAQNDTVKNMLTNITNPFLLLFLGFILTVAVQSSSVITSLLITMAIAGTMVGGAGNGVLYVILGSNIGSTSTALISAIGSTPNGKRAAVIHLLFNTFGAVIFFIILICVPQFMDVTFASWFADKSEQIAMFHTFFNVSCTLIFLPFIKLFVKLATLIIPEPKKAAKGYQAEILDERFLKNPGIALNQAIMYYHLMAKKALEDLNLSIDAFVSKDESKKEEIDKIEQEVLQMSRNLVSFNVKILSAGVSEEGNARLSKMQLDIADIVRLTEVADNITGYTFHEVKESLIFSPIVFDQIQQMKDFLNQQFINADTITEKPNLDLLMHSRQLEDQIDNLRTSMIEGHMDRLSKGLCHPESSDVFINLVGNLERCGDHFNFICERACEKLTKSLSTHA